MKAGDSWPDAVEQLLSGGSLTTLAAQGVATASRFRYAAFLDRVRQMAATRCSRYL